ncbi:hypothetical protein Ahy_A09g042789 [Arachis hypogaea]|uniref:Uncharacterized protein n=1 Tax=Arachis hypogaea TaxID=3818 RepID=A0A445BGT7_ARAHY|nr:hypothetical protein Ahy_A09g042789 [Arachis hypogaea]
MDIEGEATYLESDEGGQNMKETQKNVSCTCACRGSSRYCGVLTTEDIRNHSWMTSDAAYECYVSYAKSVGFGVRKGDAARGKDGKYRRRRFFCNKAGHREEKYYNNPNRKREHKAETRTGCEAKLSIYLDESSSVWKWHPDEFELRWAKMVDTFGLQNNEWVNIQYARKENWASSYLMDKFCAGFRTTSRCEGINNYVKTFINSHHCLLDLVTNLERAVRDYRNNEMVAQFKTIYGEPVLTTGLTNLERSAAEAYTKEIYRLVKKEIQAVVALELIEDRSISTTMIYKVYHHENRDRLYTVMYDRNDKNIECECKRWNSEGIPCRHMFCVMKREACKEIPEKLILKRWTKRAKHFSNETNVRQSEIEKERGFLMRFAALSVATTWMSFIGAQELPLFHHTMKEVCRLTREIETKTSKKQRTEEAPTQSIIGDPSVVKTKGAPKLKKDEKGRRKCKNCGKEGHTKRTCAISGKEETHAMNEELNTTIDEAKTHEMDPIVASQMSSIIGNTPPNEDVARDTNELNPRFSVVNCIPLISNNLNEIPQGSYRWMLQVMQNRMANK